MKTGAIIIADQTPGWSEAGIFQPMAQLEGTTAIKKAITTLRQAGVSPILVVTGYQAETLERHIAHHGTVCVFNERFEENSMIVAMKLGLSQARESCDQVLCLPADTALFSLDTVKVLMKTKCDGDVLVPTWKEQSGFPVLMRLKGLECVMAAPEEGECFCTLQDCGLTVGCVPVEDKGVSLRIRSEEEYKVAQQYAKEIRDAKALKCDVKVYLKKSDDFFGPGVARFLLMVEEKGSMLAACQEMNMSYSKGWKMVKAVEDEMGFPFLIRQTGGSSGGSSRLTEEGREFIRKYQALQRDAYKTAEAFFSLYFSDFQ